MFPSRHHTRRFLALFALALVGAAALTAPATRTESAAHHSSLTLRFPALAGATLITDKSDYLPGETVRVTGGGWSPGETVMLVLHREPMTAPDDTFSAIADTHGLFTDASYTIQPFDYGITFTLTAIGQTSGLTAQTTFTDAPIALVQKATATAASNSITATFGAAVTAGHLIVAIVGARDENNNLTINTPGSYSLAVKRDAGNGKPAQAIFYKVASGGETSVTVTTSASDTLGLHIYDYSGIATSSPLDATASSSGTTNTPSSGSVTTTNANDLLIAGLVIRRTSGSYATPSNSFTEQNDFLASGTNGNIVLAGEDRIVSATGSYSTSATVSGAAANWTGLIAAFKQAPNLAPTVTKQFGSPSQVTSITVGDSVPLQFTVTNPNASVSLSSVGFTDTLPAGLVVASPSTVTGSCGGGMITVTAGSGTISLLGATLAGNSSCTFSVNVQGTTSGLKTNNVQASGNDGTATLTGGTSSAMLNVDCPMITLNSPTSSATVGVIYSGSVAASCAAPSGFSYQYSLANSTTLPPGLMLNTSTGAITGTPTTAGTYTFDIKAELFNASATTTGCATTATKSIRIECPTTPTIMLSANAVCANSTGHTASVTAVAGASYTWSVTGGSITSGQGTNQIEFSVGTGNTVLIELTIQVGTNCTLTPTSQTIALSCPAAASAQKAGSLLVFPYYTSDAGGNFSKADTLITITNASDGAATLPSGVPAYQFLHLFFLRDCSPADTFVCLTPNGSLQIRASEYDPLSMGYLIAVAVDEQGHPTQNNSFVGIAFVRDDVSGVIDAYQAAAFVRHSAAPAPVSNGSVRLALDGVMYDAAPIEFATPLRDPALSEQTIILASVSGDLGIKMASTEQAGAGLIYRADEALASFQSKSSGCFLALIVDNANFRVVPGTLAGFLKGNYGYLRLTLSAPAVGLIVSRQGPHGAGANRWSGIRALHRTKASAATLTLPLLSPFCG